MKIKIKLDENAIMPTRAHETDAGLDLYAPYAVTVYGNDYDMPYETIDTGVHIEIPKGYVGFLKSKSGLNVKHNITGEGVIDSGYTGSIVVKLYNNGQYNHCFRKGDKIIQLVLLPIITPDLELVDEFEQTERGDNGFGSTGR